MTKKVIIITGASRGIGAATAKELSRDGRLFLLARNAAALENLAAEIRAHGGEATTFACDVTNAESVHAAVEKCLDTYGRIDVLINNAGIGKFKRIDEFTPAEFEEIFRVNVFGTFLMTKAAAPIFMRQNSGLIINVSSVAGLSGFKSGTAYAASKFAVMGFTESLREDLKSYGIAVCAVCPGSVRTGFADDAIRFMSAQDFILEPEDVARSMRYLVDESETANTKMLEIKPRRRTEFRGP